MNNDKLKSGFNKRQDSSWIVGSIHHRSLINIELSLKHGKGRVGIPY